MSRGLFVRGCVVSAVLLILPAAVVAQEKSVKPGVNQRFEDPQLDVKEWVERFEREGRETFEKREQIVAFLRSGGFQPPLEDVFCGGWKPPQRQ